jgi:hypothetical protein
MKILLIATLALSLYAQTGQQAWLRDPTSTGTGECRVVGVTVASPAVFTCAAGHGYSVGQRLTLENVQGPLNVNGVARIVASVPSSTTFTLTDSLGNPINTTQAFIPPIDYSTIPDNYSYGYASPVKLYILNPHPRIGGMSGPSTGLAAILASGTKQANPSGAQYQALQTAYNQSVGAYSTWSPGCGNSTVPGEGCGPYVAAALKWFEDGQPTGAEQTFATYLVGTIPGLDQMYAGGMACDETQNECGPVTNIDYPRQAAMGMDTNYDLVWGVLSSSQRQQFANYMLNDISTAQGGFGMSGAPNSSCTKPPTTDPYNWANDGHCGVYWETNHHPGSWLSNPQNYPTSGGLLPNISNQGSWTSGISYFITGMTLCGDDGGDPVADRGCAMLSEASVAMWDQAMGNLLGQLGIGIASDYYDRGRVNGGVALYYLTVENAVIGFPSLPSFPMDNFALEYIYDTLPYSPFAGDNIVEGPHWGQSGGYLQDMNDTGGLSPVFALGQASAAAAPYLLYWLQNTTNWWSAANFGSGGQNQNYTFSETAYLDPSLTPLNYNTLPQQRFFGPPANIASICSSLNLNCTQYPGATTEFSMSRTGWGPTDTVLRVEADLDWFYETHNPGCPGCIRLYRKQGLLGGDDGGTVSGNIGSENPNASNGDNIVEVGGTENNLVGGGNCAAVLPYYGQAGYFGPPITRWAGGLPNGPASNDYSYQLVDLHKIFCPSKLLQPNDTISYFNKEIAHFKKSGSQDYIMVHVDAGATPNPIQWREYVHLRTKQDETTTSYSPGVSLGSNPNGSLTSTAVSISDTITGTALNSKFLNLAGGATMYVGVQPGVETGTYTSGITATGTAGQTCNLTTFNGGSGTTATVALTGTNTIASGTALNMVTGGTGYSSAPTSATATSGTATCSGRVTVSTTINSGTGNADCQYQGELETTACRIEVGSSNDGQTLGATLTGEWAYVHQPCNGTGCTMPAITQPSCSSAGALCAAIQVADSGNPKVWAFARQGGTLTGISFTTSFSGTAQYLITGLTPGIYAVTVGGTAVSGSPRTVANGDNSVEFEAAAGLVAVSATSGLGAGTAIAGNPIVAGSVVIY